MAGRRAQADAVRVQVEFGTCIWTTGIKMNPLTTQLCSKLPAGMPVATLPDCNTAWRCPSHMSGLE